jgi:hypothetical protein
VLIRSTIRTADVGNLILQSEVTSILVKKMRMCSCFKQVYASKYNYISDSKSKHIISQTYPSNVTKLQFKMMVKNYHFLSSSFKKIKYNIWKPRSETLKIMRKLMFTEKQATMVKRSVELHINTVFHCLTSVLIGVGGQHHALVVLTSGNIPATN